MNNRVNIWLACLVTVLLSVNSSYSAEPVSASYTNNFESAEVGKLPSDVNSLNGDFTVKSNGTNKFLELPGAPVDAFALSFGPAQSGDVTARARIFGTAKGRRLPTFGLGTGGVAGYRLQVSPAKKALEMYRDQDLKATVTFDWKPGEWTLLRLDVRKLKEGEWKIQGKAWTEGTAEPSGWSVEFTDTEAPLNGRASVSASPFSGTPIWFDDLTVVGN
jgi:hypothetical protein